MDLKTRLEDEKLFFPKPIKGRLLANLNKRNIYTVEDFINCDIDEIMKYTTKSMSYKAFQRILRNKYLGEDLVLDVLFEAEYHGDEFKVIDKYDYLPKLYRLGLVFKGHDSSVLHSLVENKFIKDGSIKIIDIIKIIGTYFPDYKNLTDYYINLYNRSIEEEQITEVNASTVEELKNQIMNLLKQKAELDYKISQLTEQVIALEGGSTTNGRKQY